MVCVPCFVIPFFLFIWYRYLQPLVLKFWNPWKPVEDKQVLDKNKKESEKDDKNENLPATQEKQEILSQEKLKVT